MVSSNSFQAESTDPQVVSTSVFQAVSSWNESTSKAASASSTQTVSYQADSTNSERVSTVPPQAGRSRAVSTDAQASSTSPQTYSTNSQGTSTNLPQALQANRQSKSANTPWGSPRGNSLENPNPKWVINLSSKPLTQTQRSLLAKGPNFEVASRHPPNLEYIMAIEAPYTKPGQQDTEKHRAEINRVLPESSQQPKPNLTKAQSQAIREIKRDKDCIVLTADKGVTMVIMNRQEYINKSKHLLNQPTCMAIPWDPTKPLKTN